MDNLTHTLIGLAAGEAMARCTAARSEGLVDPTRRSTLLIMGMVGGNLPDIDLLWSMELFTGDRVTYLVEHRGYTHTLVGCAALALLLLLGVLAVLRWRGQPVRAPDARLLGVMALVSIMLHLGMDSLNEYGVHPFWPWDNRWYYGDTLFIVEPLCWLATAPLLFSFRSRGARVLLAVVFAIGCAAVLAFHQSGGVWWALPVLVLFLILGGKLLTPGTAAILSCALVCIVIGVFSVARVIVSHRVETVAARLFPGAKTLDIVLSPSPAHPLCWDVMLLQSAGNEYVARLGQFSLKSGSTGTCARMLRGQGTAPLVTLQMPVISGLRWTHAFSMDTRDLVRLAASTCDTRRAASFLRAPFATETSKGWIIGDLRYDRELGPGFAELVFDARVSSSCENLVPWTAPRSDIGF